MGDENKVGGIPQPGQKLDNPTTMADGRRQSPTVKNHPTDLASGKPQGAAKDTSTGQRTARANEHPAEEQSSGAKKYRGERKEEVEARKREEEEGNE